MTSQTPDELPTPIGAAAAPRGHKPGHVEGAVERFGAEIASARAAILADPKGSATALPAETNVSTRNGRAKLELLLIAARRRRE